MAEPGEDFTLDDDFDAPVLSDDPGPPGDGEEPIVPPAPQPGVSVEQMQQMMDRQAQQFAEQQATNMQMMQQALRPPAPGPEVIEAPDDAALQAAIEGGDAALFLRLSNQKQAAQEQRHQAQLTALAQQAAGRFTEVNAALLDTAVPGYAARKEAVGKQMDELGLSGDLRTNPKVIEILTRAEEGRPENIEATIRARQEAQRRKGNDDPPGDVTGTTRRSAGRTPPVEPVFTPDGLQALAYAGHDPETFARKLSGQSWEEYQASTRELYADETLSTHKFMKGREAEFRR